MSEIKIEKNIPMPTGGKHNLPFKAMEVGDSFFIEEAACRRCIVQGYASNWKRRTGREFTVRKQGTGCRVWRIA